MLFALLSPPALAYEKGEFAVGVGLSLILLAVLPPAGIMAVAWLLRVAHRRIRSLGLSLGWSVLAGVWAASLLGLLFATGKSKNGDWLGAVVEKMPISLVVMLMAFGLFVVFAKASVARMTTTDLKGAWWAARLSALHMTLLQLPSILVGLAMPPLGILFLPVLLTLGTNDTILGPLQTGHQLLSLGLPQSFRTILHGLDAAIFCAALYYLVARQDDGEPPVAIEPSAIRGTSPPRTSFGRRGN
jgi:hypothetical protein